MEKFKEDNNPTLGFIHSNLGAVYLDLNYLDKAQPQLELALKLDLNLYGEEHP